MTDYETLYRDLVAGVTALADDWYQFTNDDWFDHTPREHADYLRALVVQPSLAEGEDCQHCDGRGIVDSADHRCAWCGGSGRTEARALLASSPAEGEGEPDGCRLNGCHPAPVSSGERVPLRDAHPVLAEVLDQRRAMSSGEAGPLCVDPECDQPAVPGRLIDLCQPHMDAYKAWVAAGRPARRDLS